MIAPDVVMNALRQANPDPDEQTLRSGMWSSDELLDVVVDRTLELPAGRMAADGQTTSRRRPRRLVPALVGAAAVVAAILLAVLLNTSGSDGPPVIDQPTTTQPTPTTVPETTPTTPATTTTVAPVRMPTTTPEEARLLVETAFTTLASGDMAGFLEFVNPIGFFDTRATPGGVAWGRERCNSGFGVRCTDFDQDGIDSNLEQAAGIWRAMSMAYPVTVEGCFQGTMPGTDRENPDSFTCYVIDDSYFHRAAGLDPLPLEANPAIEVRDGLIQRMRSETLSAQVVPGPPEALAQFTIYQEWVRDNHADQYPELFDDAWGWGGVTSDPCCPINVTSEAAAIHAVLIPDWLATLTDE